MSERYAANPNELSPSADRPHAARYYVARGFLRPGYKVIDAACGYGYGTYILSKYCNEVIGYDKEADVIQACQTKWDGLEFRVAHFETDPFIDEKCNAFVCLETIEHLRDPQKFLDRVTEITSDRIIISSPNTPTAGLNEFHLSDVTLVQLEKLMAKYPDWVLYNTFLQGQYYIAVYVHKDSRLIA